MKDIEEAEIISKDFILVKFRYRDEYFWHLNRGSDYKLKLMKQEQYWTILNNSGDIQYMPFNIDSDMAIIHSSKHNDCVILVLEYHKLEEEKEEDENEEENDDEQQGEQEERYTRP